MGVFSKKRTYVFTQVQPMFDLAQMSDPTKEAALRALVWGSDLMDEYFKAVKSGVHTQFEAAYLFAKKGNYAYGTPNLQHFGQERLKNALKPILEGIYGTDSSIEYFLLGEISPVFAGFDYVYNQFGYNQTTNEVLAYSTAEGFQCFLYDVIGHYVQDSRDELRVEDSFWSGINPRRGATPSRIYSANFSQPTTPPTLGSINGVEIVYEWVDGTGQIQTGNDLIDLSGYDGNDYFQAIVKQANGNIAVWKYLIGSGTYPTLDALTNIEFLGTGDYFPFIPFRANKQNLTAEGLRETPEYLSTVDLMKQMKLDYQGISDQIHSSPDIADIEQAILTLVVNGDTSDQVDLEYLFKFFSGFVDQGLSTKLSQTVNWEGYASPPANTSLLRWSDAGFEMRLSVQALSRKFQVGNVAPVGKYALLKDTYTYAQAERNPQYRENISGSEPFRNITKTSPIFRYCYQNNIHLYTEVEIIGATAEYQVTGELSTEFYSDEAQFVVPVDINYVRTMQWRTRQKFYIRNFQFIFNSKIIQKLKWYETGIFKAVMAVAAFIAAAYGMVQISYILADIITASTVAAALATAGTLVAKLVIMKLLGLAIVKLAGPEYALIVEAILFVVSLGQSGGNFNLGLFNLPLPEALMGAVSGLQSAITSELKTQFAEYNEKQQSFLEDTQGKLEGLEQFKKDMELDLLDSPFKDKYMVPMRILNEAPDQFFARTVHSGNVGTLSFKSIETFVSNSLKLPNIERDPRIEVSIYG